VPACLLSFLGLADAISSQGGMPEPLAPSRVSPVNSKCRFVITGESLPPVIFTASLGWLIMSAAQCVMLNFWFPAEEDQV
jgi:hypothetical protein